MDFIDQCYWLKDKNMTVIQLLISVDDEYKYE